jgi:hypothetical protein
MLRKHLPALRKALWAVFLVSLPVSSFPYFPPSIGGGSASVRPLLVYPLFLLVILVTFPTLWKRNLPPQWLPFIVFVLLALFSSLLPFLRGVDSQLKGVEVAPRVIRSLITLALAGAIYFTVSSLPRDEGELRFTLRWLYGGLAVALFWGTLQILYVLELIPNWYQVMKSLQDHVSISKLFRDRVSGMALEPSWFADQLAALWLPWVLAAFLTDYTAFRWRWKWITVEKILLGWLGVVLLFTLSRSGFGVAALVITFGVLFLRRGASDKETDPLPGSGADRIRSRIRDLPVWVRRGTVALLVLVVLVGMFVAVSTQSDYISRMWEYWTRRDTRNLQDYFNYIGFGPRFVYWRTAYRLFTRYPLFGVGLGNYTFYFVDFIPPVQLGYMPELLRRFVPGGRRVITSKNFLTHLLAETGFFGTAAFGVFFLVLLGGALYLWLSEEPDERYWGTASLLGLLAFLIDTFSYDSFAVPNPWVVFGLVTAAVSIFSRKNKIQEEEGGSFEKA